MPTARPRPTLPDIAVSLDRRYFAVVEAALALTRTTEEYDANAFFRSTEANKRLLKACHELDDHWAQFIDNPFARNAVSEQLEAELPKVGLYIAAFA